MKNLIIGHTSQIAQYFPQQNYEYVSSRSLDIDYIISQRWGKIYICSAEQRTFVPTADFEEYNVNTTVNLINQIKDSCDYLIVYSTAELWNKVHGKINLRQPHKFNPTPYILSKKKMTDLILSKPNYYSNVIILYPFNFNSTYRAPGFLFGKIFDSILNKRKIEIGNTYFYRESLHPSYVVKQSLAAREDAIVGSGRVVFVNDFIRDLYKECGLVYEDYVKENIDNSRKPDRDIYFLDSKKCLYSYEELLSDTIKDVKNKMTSAAVQ